MRVGRRGLVLAALHTLLVVGVGGRYLADRARLPRAWVRCDPFDPATPLRGRYVRLAVEVQVQGRPERGAVALEVDGDRLVAVASRERTGLSLRAGTRPGQMVLEQPLAFFLPEHVPDPSLRGPGEALWAEVSVPPRGLPRPLRLGVRRGGGPIEPLDLR